METTINIAATVGALWAFWCVGVLIRENRRRRTFSFINYGLPQRAMWFLADNGLPASMCALVLFAIWGL